MTVGSNFLPKRRQGIPECWLTILSKREIEVYRQPSPEGYLSRSGHGPGDILEPLHAPAPRSPYLRYSVKVVRISDN